MQALLFLGIFGFMATVIGGIIALSNVTTQKLRLLMNSEVHQQFRDVSTMINQQYVLNYLQSPVPAGGVSQDAGPFICAIADVRQIIDCSSGLPLDPWHHAITGKVVRQARAMATKNNLIFSVPVTAYALLSAGPDGIANTTLPTNPATIAQLTSLSATGDDILEVFTDSKGQESNVASIENAATRIGLAAQRQFQQQFGQIKPNLSAIYASMNVGTSDVTSAQMQNAWKVWSDSGHLPPSLPTDPSNTSQVAAYLNNMANYRPTLVSYTTPNFNRLFVGGTFNTYSIGADGDVDTIQRPLPSGGQMVLNASVSDTDIMHYGINDVLRLSVSTTSTVWPQVTSDCNATPPINCVQVKGTI